MKKNGLKKLFIIMLMLAFFSILAIVLIQINHYYWSLKGNKLTNGIYLYSVGKHEGEYIPTIVKEDAIFYLKKENGNYNLYERNIRKKVSKIIDTINGNYDYCYFEDDYIECSNETQETSFFDYKTNKLYTKNNNENNYTITILYNGKFLEIDNNKIYDNNNLIKEINIDGEYYYQNNFIYGDNTYLVYYSREEDSYIYYDIKNDKYEMQKEPFFIKYNKGYYAKRLNEIIAYDILNNKISNYKVDILGDGLFNTYELVDDILYMFANNYLYKINLKDDTIDKVEFYIDKTINQIVYKNGYIFLITNNDEYDIYVIDMNKVNKTSYTIKEYQEYMKNLTEEKIKNLEEEYHVNIIYKNDVNIDNETFRTTILEDDFLIQNAADQINVVLKKFNKEFFDEFYKDDNKGINIYLSGTIISSDKVDTVYFAAAYTQFEDNEYRMIVDASTVEIKSTICHELMHSIENRMNDFAYDEWYKKNPKNFGYIYSYRNEANEKYTMMEEDKNKVYFIDTYAKKYPTEDMARTFENICSYEENSSLIEYPHLYEKGLFLKDEILKEFPMLETESVFNSLNKKEAN